MPSVLAWVDHDATARERTLRILSLFQEKESRDELGLGGVRDSFADQLFPGTSTIQTRLRYMLIVPWIYQCLEAERVPGTEFARQADVMERGLVVPLMESDDRAGIFGRMSGKRLKRLPSSVYWAGLGAWGLRLATYSQGEYHLRIDAVFRNRDAVQRRVKEAGRMGDDRETVVSPEATWHPRIPPPPKDFPDQISFRLTKGEAEFIQERILHHHPHSLLAHLALHCSPVAVDTPWEHPAFASFSESHQELLLHAKLFSGVMRGAALLYNIMLSQLRDWPEKIEQHRETFSDWAAALPAHEVRAWDTSRLWQLTLNKGHTITRPTRAFVDSWVGMVKGGAADLVDDPSARNLVESRESRLKGPRSRFRNQRALDQWGGSSGTGQLLYRWPNVQTLLADLYAGLAQEGQRA